MGAGTGIGGGVGTAGATIRVAVAAVAVCAKAGTGPGANTRTASASAPTDTTVRKGHFLPRRMTAPIVGYLTLFSHLHGRLRAERFVHRRTRPASPGWEDGGGRGVRRM
ncbi:hypothetical protein Misp01_27210 [Microtetraspora sp. NBRC 13810]|nr:hypothetical protein Misp01_27210 [Microtetraspora sp. NBRC 13810]